MRRNRYAVYDRYLLKTRRVYLWGEINTKLAKSVTQSLLILGKTTEPIYLCIHSPGGYVDDTIPIIDTMAGLKEQGNIVYTIAQGQAYSAAAIVLSLGSSGYRYIYPNATVMLHEWSYGLAEDYASQQKRSTDFLDEQSDIMTELVAAACQKGTPKKLKTFKDDLAKTIWLSAADAIKYKVVDDYWDFNWDKEISTISGEGTSN